MNVPVGLDFKLEPLLARNQPSINLKPPKRQDRIFCVTRADRNVLAAVRCRAVEEGTSTTGSPRCVTGTVALGIDADQAS